MRNEWAPHTGHEAVGSSACGRPQSWVSWIGWEKGGRRVPSGAVLSAPVNSAQFIRLRESLGQQGDPISPS